MTDSLTILGIESSCDDTSAAIVTQIGDEPAEILSNVVYGQTELHAAFGGVVPEIAARAHAEKLDLAVEEALKQADVGFVDVDAIAVTAGPGLIGGVISGVMCAKGLSAGLGIPLIGVNHLAGHALTPRLTDQIKFPYLMLLGFPMLTTTTALCARTSKSTKIPQASWPVRKSLCLWAPQLTMAS